MVIVSLMCGQMMNSFLLHARPPLRRLSTTLGRSTTRRRRSSVLGSSRKRARRVVHPPPVSSPLRESPPVAVSVPPPPQPPPAADSPHRVDTPSSIADQPDDSGMSPNNVDHRFTLCDRSVGGWVGEGELPLIGCRCSHGSDHPLDDIQSTDRQSPCVTIVFHLTAQSDCV